MIEALSSCEWLGPQGLREGWFSSNVWGPIVDGGLQGVDNLVLSRYVFMLSTGCQFL